jgi:hypothetical protein
LNYGGIKPDLLPFVCDVSEAKQNKFLPGSHIPIISPSALQSMTIDFVVILPWNITTEVQQQLSVLADKGTQFITVVPRLQILQQQI